MRLRDRVVVLLGIIAALAVTLAAVPASAVDFTVNMTTSAGGSFSPKDLVINAGDRVRWRNQTTLQHTSTSGPDCDTQDGLWDTGFMNAGTFSAYVTFNAGGFYPYYCMIHCFSGMTGTITVNPPVAVAITTWGAIKALYATTE
jgi:plastocyanin